MTTPSQLPTTDKKILAALDSCTLATTHAASGHDIRQYLQAEGMDKRMIAETLAGLVEAGILQRVRIEETSGLFYMAYRRTPV